MAYVRPEVLVEIDWVQSKLGDPTVKIVEVDVDTAAYEEGHIPGAVAWDWGRELSDQRTRDILSKAAFEELCRKSGINNGDTVVLYGDNHNWFAAWAFWQLKIFGHADVRLMNGGRGKWLAAAHPLTDEVPQPTRSSYEARPPDLSLRAMLDDVRVASAAGSHGLIDVRSAAEFTGELLSPPGLPETCQRGGHIPGAHCVPWGKVVAEDGRFRSYEELKALYGGDGIDTERPMIAYCRIGERSSHTWFVLKYLLGVKDVRNYDGSWTEWGNLVGAAIER